jgi:hypothetical protein
VTRSAFVLLGLLLAVGADPARAQEPGGIEWNHDLAAATAKAVEEGRPLVLYFTFET